VFRVELELRPVFMNQPVVNQQTVRNKNNRKKTYMNIEEPSPAPDEIIRCLLLSGFTLDEVGKYCRSAASSVFSQKNEALAYAEAADRMESMVRSEELALAYVEGMNQRCTLVFLACVVELEKTIVTPTPPQ
jgi:hypothetical protein